jgi:hypothetical protein
LSQIDWNVGEDPNGLRASCSLTGQLGQLLQFGGKLVLNLVDEKGFEPSASCMVAVFYVIATCGSLFFSRIKDMVVFGGANLVILSVVMAVKRYAFTSLWCAYAALASVIILAYFWKSMGRRPFQYAEAAVERL